VETPLMNANVFVPIAAKLQAVNVALATTQQLADKSQIIT